MIRKTNTLMLVVALLVMVFSGCAQEQKQYSKANVDLSGSAAVPQDSSENQDSPADVMMRDEPNKTEGQKLDEKLAGIVADGSYSEEFTYDNHKSTDHATLDFTVEDGLITAFEVVPVETTDYSKVRISAFNEGVQEYVIGKAFADIELPTVVSGSSLTTAAVMKKIEAIKAN